MADPNLPEYKRFTITSKKDPVTGSFPVPDYTKDIQAFTKAIESALPKGAFYHIGEKYVNKLGQLSQDFYTYPEHASAVGKSLRYEAGRLGYKGGDQKYKVIARRKELDEDTRYNIREAELAPQRAEDEKLAKQQEKDARKRAKEEEREKERQQKAEEREAREHFRHAKSFFLKVLGVLTVLTDVARRILSAVIDFATQSQKDMIQAHNLGMSYETVRAFRNTEISHGMREGVLTEGVSDIQTKFGNITKLDEQAIEDLAVVMGGKVKEMVNVALNEQSPEKAMGIVLDTFMEKANAGYNSVGQYVGEQNARRELYSYLLRISPAWAEIFATMQEEQHNINSLFRNQASTFEEWRKLLPTSRGDHTSMEYNVTATLGQEWNVLRGILEQIKQSVVLTIAPTLLSVLRKISNFRIGYSEAENRKLNETNKDANTKALNQTNQTISLMESAGELSEADSYYLSALKDYKTELEKANAGNKKGNIYYAVRTPEELRVMALKKAKKGAESSLGGELKVVSMKNAGYGAPYVSTLRTTDEVLPEADEVADVVKAYPSLVDLDKAKQEYEEYRRKQFGIEKERVLKQALKAKREEAEARANEEAYNAVYKDKSSPYYRNFLERMNVRDTKATSTVAYIESLFNTKLEGDNIDQKLADAVAKGYAYYGADQIVRSIPLTDEMFSDSDFVKATIRDLRDKYAYTEEDFLLYLYENNKDKFKEHIEGARYGQLKQGLETGNLYSSIFALRDTEATQASWLDKIPSTYTSGGTVRAYNVEDRDNEVVHKIVLDYEGKEYELGNFQGMRGYTGNIGELKVTNDGVQITKTAGTSTSGIPASKQALSAEEQYKRAMQANPYYNR